MNSSSLLMPVGRVLSPESRGQCWIISVGKILSPRQRPTSVAVGGSDDIHSAILSFYGWLDDY